MAESENAFLDFAQFRRFEDFELYAKHEVQGFLTGKHRSPFHGFSVEFSEHAIYNPGESIRHVDWKLYGRTDRMYTKRYEEETNLRCQLVLDTSASMQFPLSGQLNYKEPNKLLFASIAAMSLLQLLRKQRDACGLQFFGQHQDHLKAKGGIPHQKIIAHQLWEKLQLSDIQASQYPLHEQLHLLAERVPKRALICVFSDFFDYQDPERFEQLKKAVQHLVHYRHELIFFWPISRRLELELQFESGPHQFEDLETGERYKLDPSELQAEYSRATAEFERQMQEFCQQYHIDFNPCDLSAGMDLPLRAFLEKRKKMF